MYKTQTKNVPRKDKDMYPNQPEGEVPVKPADPNHKVRPMF